MTAIHPLTCRRCGAPVRASAYACACCGTLTAAGERVQEAAWLEVEPTPDELIAMLDEIDLEDDEQEWTGAYAGESEGW